ncbi:MAG: hypothetical protein JO099_09240 [Acidobacteriia bacterium]|nr:hypothetical protein [Terriglobia bacterium]
MKIDSLFIAMAAPAFLLWPAFCQNQPQGQQQNVLAPRVRGVIDAEAEKRIGVPTGPVPRLKNGKPDMSGVWNQPYVPDMSKNGRGQQGASELPFSQLGLAKWKAYDASQGDYTGNCLPFGLLRNINSPHPMQIVQNDNYIAFLFEQNTWFHVVPTDGRPHSKNVDSTWDGNSVGRWEGDTLVIDTIGLNDKTRLDTIGHPHSDKMHVIEKLQRIDAGHIAYEITIDDPLYYTRPWSNTRTFVLRPDWEIMEYSCEENNKDIIDGHIKPFNASNPVPKN